MATLTPKGEGLRRLIDVRCRALVSQMSMCCLRASLEGEAVLGSKYHTEALRICRALPRFHRFWTGFVERNFSLPH